MGKVRVYEYAKKNNVSSKVVINKLKDMGIDVNNHMTALEDQAVTCRHPSAFPEAASFRPDTGECNADTAAHAPEDWGKTCSRPSAPSSPHPQIPKWD